MLDFHPAANLFPLLEGAEYESLKADIDANGLRVPIVIDAATETILDGRNRYRVCCELGIDYTTTAKFYEGDDPYSYVYSLNAERRDLTPSQRATIAIDFEIPMAREASERRKATQNNDAGRAVVEIFPPLGKARDLAAEAVGVNPRYVSDMKRIKETAPDVFDAVWRGELNVPQAKQLERMPEEQRFEVGKLVATKAAKSPIDAIRIVKKQSAKDVPFPEGKYRVLYADPPWEYGGLNLDYYGPAERHYPTMPLTDLCALPVADLAAENSVLFLWATSPLLPQALTLLSSWGFIYKASFVWDKVKHNFGHYNSVRHELLLIATRGSCMPDADTLLDSVVELERTENHSEKPEEFRQIIDVMYPHGPRLELFARRHVDGWEAWGDELNPI